MNIFNHKKTILIIIVVLLVFFGYWYMFISKKDILSENNNLKASIPKSNITQYDKEFVSTLTGLKPVNLDVSFLETKAFGALNYPETPFVINYSKDSGRINPFLPIGVDVLLTNNSAQTQIQNKTNVQVENITQSNSSSTTSTTTSTTTTIIKTPSKPTPKTF
jgi:hypothetical protein